MPRKIVTYQQQHHSSSVSSVDGEKRKKLGGASSSTSVAVAGVHRSKSDPPKKLYSVHPIQSSLLINQSISHPDLTSRTTTSCVAVASRDLKEIEVATSHLSVTRRVKNHRSNTASSGAWRRGVVFNVPVEVSSPIISVNSAQNNKRSTIAEQERLLKQLVQGSPPSSELKQEDTSPPPSRFTKNRMADRIQRTIKALYDGKDRSSGGGGSSSSKKSFKQNSASPKSKRRNLDVTMAIDEEEGNLRRQAISNNNELKSPKPEKKSLPKKRSPKPSRNHSSMQLKDVDGSRRFKWRGSVNKIAKKFGQGNVRSGGTFGVNIEDCPSARDNEHLPFVVDLCCRIVEERGLTFKGIYRVPGNTGTLNALQEELNIRGPEEIDIETDERFNELNVVSSLLKSFFRNLPDPLFTNDLYKDFIKMNRIKEQEKRLSSLRELVHMLPAPHYETLKFLIEHLRRVSDNQEFNMMGVKNLAIVFGPTLVRTTVELDDMATMISDMSDQCRIVESILQHEKLFFSGEHEEIPTFMRSFLG